MLLTFLTCSSDSSTVDATPRAIGGTLVAKESYVFWSSTNCFIRQGTSKLVTCVAKANLVDGETVTINLGQSATAKTYEFDVSGNGVKTGNIQVNVSADTTAAQVAARLRTAILANQTLLEVTDNTDGTLTVVAPDLIMVITETVANAGFTIADAVMTVTAGDKSMFVVTPNAVPLSGSHGPQLAVVQATAGGTASLTHVEKF